MFGQSLATALLLTGAIKARVTDLICMVLLTIVRTALGFYCVHLLIKGELEFFLMFFFRAMDQFIMGSTPVMAVQVPRHSFCCAATSAPALFESPAVHFSRLHLAGTVGHQ